MSMLTMLSHKSHATMKSGSADAQREAAEETMAEMDDDTATMRRFNRRVAPSG